MKSHPQERARLETLLEEARSQGVARQPLGQIVVWAGRQFLGAPYGTAPLERAGAGAAVVDLHTFDCVTFLETSLALALLVRQAGGAFRTSPGS